MLNKIQDEDFIYHQFKDKLLLSLDKSVSSLQFIEYLAKKLNEQAKSANDFRVLQSEHLSEEEKQASTKIDLKMTALWLQQEEIILQIHDQSSSKVFAIQDYIKQYLQNIENTLINPINITNKQDFSVKQMHHMALMSREQTDQGKVLYLEGLFEYEKTSEKEKRNIGLKIAGKSTDTPGVYQMESVRFGSENQTPFFFDETQVVSLYDKTIMAQNLDKETFLRHQYNPFLEDQQARLWQKSQQHYLVIRIHLVPDEDSFADLIEQFTRQCLMLSQQRAQQWRPGRFFEPFNQQKKDDHAFGVQKSQEDNWQNPPYTTSQQDWKIKSVCIDRVMFHVAPDMTLQAIRAGRDQDVIQSLASNAR